MNIAALVLFYKDHKQFSQRPNPNACGQADLDKDVDWITKGDENTDEEGDDIMGAGKLNIHGFIG
jgi:hypothetical protein